jgi:uncharacterized protein YbjT (DUF2867 family)
MRSFLILGGTGKTGRRTAQLLADAGHHARAASRHPGEPAAGVEPVPFDWDAPGTWAPALEGVEAVYLVPPALRLDYVPVVREFIDAAREAGVARVVFLSARGGNLDPQSPLAQVEQLLAESGLEWAAIRPSWFAQNFTENFFRPTIDSDALIAFPAGDGAEPFIDVDDIAEVAAALLTTSDHAGQGYDLSGPEALTFNEVAELLSNSAERPLSYVSPDPEEWRQGLVAAGIPEDYSHLLATLAGLIRDGHDAHTSDGVRQVLGRAPRTFADWAAREAGQLRQTTSAV